MSQTLLGILKTLFCLNRWNVDPPRVETWTEAENVALCCHVVYAAGGKALGWVMRCCTMQSNVLCLNPITNTYSPIFP